MNLFRLADFLNLKYQLVSVADDPKVMSEARQALKTLREVWLDGPRVKDQTILSWADDKNKGPQFDLIRELVSIVKNLGVHPSLSTTDMYRHVQRGLTISKILKDFSLSEITDAVKTSLKGGMRDPDVNKLAHQESKVRTFLRRVDSAFDNVKKLLSKHVDVNERSKIDRESIGGYEQQKAKSLSKGNINDFRFHPEAPKYGLDDGDFLGKLFSETSLRPLVERLIRAVKRGHKPRGSPVLMSAHDSFRDLQSKLQTNVDLFDVTEEEAQEQFDRGRKQEELEDKQRELAALTPAQQWSRQMQESKKRLVLEREDEPPAMTTPERLEEKIKQRDLEQKQREEALINKYNGLTFEHWMRIK